MTFKRLAPYAIASIVVILLIVKFMSAPNKSSISSTNDSFTGEYKIKGMSIQQFDSLGEKIHEIKAQESIALNESLIIQQPIVSTRVNNSSWTLTAEKAVTKNQFQSLELNNQVEIQQTKTSLPLIMKTDSLIYSSQNNLISSSAEVSIIDGTFQLKGTGFKLDLKNQSYEILSQVEGQEQ
ncbi:LPS export ABC transporter periplasmic protein LptC [Pleionea sediminis]|uniref:LPS export ABC transporter periplasmic protein LptC n=1 Tax=Pleionea sediminis TaxID=2569479 RepID=UPI0011855D1C|nr:LPS export ABC transporter periplasmic protein LptC [Pleionea sediminis]